MEHVEQCLFHGADEHQFEQMGVNICFESDAIFFETIEKNFLD